MEEGYLIEDGELGKPVKGATLIGDAETVMPHFHVPMIWIWPPDSAVQSAAVCTSRWANPSKDAITVGPLRCCSRTIQGQLQTLAVQQGISQWDLGATSSSDVSVQVDRGEPKQLKGSQRSAVTVRVNWKAALASPAPTFPLKAWSWPSRGAVASAFGDLQEPLACHAVPPKRCNRLSTLDSHNRSRPCSTPCWSTASTAGSPSQHQHRAVQRPFRAQW